jgi:hypothetical protein
MCKKIYRLLAKEVAKEMVIQLEANQHKGDREVWVNMEVNFLINDIRYHTDKLERAVKANDLIHIKEYCADIANIAGMVMDKMKVIDLDILDDSRGKRTNLKSTMTASFE